jgi:hypothetical protein
LAKCSYCEAEVETQRSNITLGSCGCAKSLLISEAKVTHGQCKRGQRTSLYHRWDAILDRCLNSGSQAYKYYGGRGIKLHEPWLDFAVFKEWAEANGYQKHLEIDRRKNDGGYTPDNCFWVTKLVNLRNTSRVKLSVEKAAEIRFSYSNGSLTRGDLSIQYGVCRSTIDKVLAGLLWV